MSKNLKKGDVAQLLAEAEELIQQINTEAIIDREEATYLQFEKHAQKLDQIKSKVSEKNENKENSGAEGMHAAILDIINALGNLRNDLS